MTLQDEDAVPNASKEIVKLFNTTEIAVDMNKVRDIYKSFPELSQRLKLEMLVSDELSVRDGRIWRGVALKWSMAMYKGK